MQRQYFPPIKTEFCKKKDARKKLNLDMNSGYTHLNTFKPKGGFYSEVTD